MLVYAMIPPPVCSDDDVLQAAGVPTVPGSDGLLADEEEAVTVADQVCPWLRNSTPLHCARDSCRISLQPPCFACRCSPTVSHLPSQ